jgi:hypothetical protein
MFESNFKLVEIPDWMEQYIPEITGDTFKTSEELIQRLGGKTKQWDAATVVTTNNSIELMKLLKERGLLNDKEQR